MSKFLLFKQFLAACIIAILSLTVLLFTRTLWVHWEEIGGVATVVFVLTIDILALLGIGLCVRVLRGENVVWRGYAQALIAEMESWDQEGIEAYHAGLLLEDNPYQQGQLAAIGWMIGWEAAKEAHLRSGKHYATYRLWLIERGTLEEYLSSPVNVKKVELINSIKTALKHLGEPYDAAARRQWIERAGYHELLSRYQSDERSDVADLENLAWLASMDAAYLKCLLAGWFLDEPVVVYQEANLTRIESALCKECA